MSNRVPELEKILTNALNGHFADTSNSVKRARQPRDGQRAKLYRAERHAFASLPRHPRAASADEIRRFLAPVVLAFNPRYIAPNVRLAGRNWSEAWSSGIRVGSDHADLRWIWIHETAHIVTFHEHRAAGVASHGREFAAIYLRLVEIAFGRTWRDRLAASFKAHGVKFRPKRNVEISPERRAELVERGRKLAALRAAKRALDAETARAEEAAGPR